MIAPLRPEDVVSAKQAQIPEAVIQAFNTLIARKILNGKATIKQDDVMELIVNSGIPRGEVFEKGWLDVEDIYREAGWRVEYDKPGYSETYPATFTFTNNRTKETR